LIFTGYAMMKREMLVSARSGGAAAVEFALVIIVLMLIVAGIVEFGRAFWHYDALTKATRDGARYMSTVAKENIGTAAAASANNPPYTSANPLTVRSVVVNAANAARVSPALDSGNVDVTCLDSSYGVVACQDNTAPANVRVAIINYNITLGGLLPLAYGTGQASSVAMLTPSTTMRYMN